MRPVIALTGATGFVGSHMLDEAIAQGLAVRALTRRDQAPRDGVTWVRGALDDAPSLDALCDGADYVLHIAGVVNAADREGFAIGNIHGTRNLIAAARKHHIRHFVHVSSLAAKHPVLSDYGWSKAGAENVVLECGLPTTIIRPPAIYGPRDTEIFTLFQMARRGIMLMPPAGRVSVIHVGDLVRLLLHIVQSNPPPQPVIYEADDGRENGWSHSELGQAIGQALGRDVRIFHAPAMVLKLAAKADRLLRGKRAKLTPDRASYMIHPDWTVDDTKRPSDDIWSAQIDTLIGLAETADWYRKAGWLS